MTMTVFLSEECGQGKNCESSVNEDGTKRYDFQFSNKRGYKTTIEGCPINSIRNIGIMPRRYRGSPVRNAYSAGIEIGFEP